VPATSPAPAAAFPRFWNEAIEVLGVADLPALQEPKLGPQIDYVLDRSPFYRDKLGAAGVAAGDVRTLDDLAQLPFTEKQELRESMDAQPPLGRHQAAPDQSLIRIHTSSGTTGKPSYIGITAHDHSVWNEVLARVVWSQGVRPTSVVGMGLRIGFFVGGLPLVDAIQAVGGTCVPVGTGESYRLVESLRNLGGTHLFCTPSYAAYLAGFTRDTFGIDAREIGLERIHVGGEPGGSVPSVRASLEEAWGAMVTEGLGNTDILPVYAGECEAQDGMHFLAPDHAVLELIDPATGATISLEGEGGTLTGELVLTHLDRECSPLVRFRTRDHVVVSTGPCSCGRTSPRMRCIGRTDDLLIVRGVNVWPSAIKDVVMSMGPRTTGELRITLDQPGPLVEPPLRLTIEYAGDADLDELRSDLKHVIRERLIVTPQIELVPEGTLPRTELKSQLVQIGDGMPR
jgi:phenylacetate-CoA ligase